MMHLNRGLIRRRIAALYQGRAALLADRIGVSRSTVFRWLDPSRDVFPRTERELIALGAALDLDPSLLWSIDEGRWAHLCRQGRAALRGCNLSRLLPPLRFATKLIAPDDLWPPPALAALYSRTWHSAVLPHRRARRGRLLVARVNGATDGAGLPVPQVWHLATRDVGAPAGPSVEGVGVISRVGPHLSIFSYSGVRIDATVTAEAAGFDLGLPDTSRALDYLLASLHPFDAKWSAAEPAVAPLLSVCLDASDCDGQGERPCPHRAFCESYRPSLKN